MLDTDTGPGVMGGNARPLWAISFSFYYCCIIRIERVPLCKQGQISFVLLSGLSAAQKVRFLCFLLPGPAQNFRDYFSICIREGVVRGPCDICHTFFFEAFPKYTTTNRPQPDTLA